MHFAASWGYEPIRGRFTDWSFSPTRILGLFPEWFAARAADWPACVRLCEFPLVRRERIDGSVI